MFSKISEGSVPSENQYIVFKSGDKFFAGRFMGDAKAAPFAMEPKEVPIFIFDEWLPIHLWA